MKTTLLSTLGLTLLAFNSSAQMRQSGTAQNALRDITPRPVTYQEYAEPRTLPSRTTTTIVNRAPCIDTLLFEDFQSQTMPAGWQNLDLDGAADANMRPQNWFIFQDLLTTTPGDTNYVAASSSWFSPAGTANNVLILSAVQPCANTVLQWASAPYEGPAFADGYKVKVSTTGTNITDFTTTLFTASESVNGTATQSAGTPHTSYNGTNGILQNWEVSLGAYDNQTIYIAFFHDSNDDNLIMIDNIFMGIVTDFDLAVNSVSTEPYFSTPISQVSPRTFTAELGLAAGASVTTPTSNVNLYQGATSVFTNAPSAPTLAGGSTVSLTTSAYTTLAVDTYTTVFTASAVETDPNLTNNVDTLIFAVSDSVFSTETGPNDGSLGIGAGASGFLGNKYTLVASDDLTSITFRLQAPTVGDTVHGLIYSMTGPNTPGVIIAQTDTIFITAATPTDFTLPILGGPINLAAGSYIVGVKESFSANVTLATNSLFYTPALSWVFFNGTWSNNEDFNFLNTYVMRANFGPYCAPPVAAFTESASNLIVSFTDATPTATSWMWDFGDGNTSTLQNPTHTYAMDGTYTVCLIAANNCDADTVCSVVTVSSCNDPIANYTSSVNVGVVNFANSSTVGNTPTNSWDFGDGQTSTTQNPTNTYASNGTYTVCLIVTDDCGADTLCSQVTVSTIGLEEANLVDGLSIYPIPVNGTMTIAKLTSGEDFKLELLNNLGQIVKVIRTNGLETVQLDLSSIVDGYYHLRVSNSVMIGTRAVLIKH